MNTPELFYESRLDGFRDDVRALGGAKLVGCALWPSKEPIAARNKLNDALNEERRERLTDEEEHWIIREAKRKRGFSAALYFICDDTEFERPKAKDPEDERAVLQREIIEGMKRQERALQRLEALMQPPVRAVR